jgi:hypothetical protein
MQPKRIYCDEAGFTGANLLDVNQPYFTFASTDIEEDFARELIDEAMDKFSLRSFRELNGELKGAELVKETEGREALEWIFDKCRKNFLVTVHDKLFAIAGKFFDITFEPIISTYKPFFFKANFHRFVVTAIYLGLKIKNRTMVEAVRDFHTIFQPKNVIDGSALKAKVDKASLDPASAVESILYLWKLNEKKILAEYNKLSDKSEGINKWTLELSLTSLHTALNYWAEKHKRMTPVCDDSVPLFELKSVIEGSGIGTYKFGEDFLPVFNGATVNLLLFGKSHESAGIQIADLIASAFYYAANNRGEVFAESLIANNLKQISDSNIIPDVDDFNPENEQAMRNYVMLLALVKNSKKGGLKLTPQLMQTLLLVQTAPLPDELRDFGSHESSSKYRIE